MSTNPSRCAKPGCHRTPEVYGSKWCSTCWYPGIHRDAAIYDDLIEEGYQSYQAAVMVGWADPPGGDD